MLKLDEEYLSGDNIAEIRDLILQRSTDKSLPGARKDGAKLGLVIEGGGMRGVVSGGMVTALEALKLKNVFDGVYGASAGAMAGAYFLTERAGFGTTIFYQCINNRAFIDVFRYFLGKPVMSTSFLLDHICKDIRFLDAEAVIASDIPLSIVATSVTTQKSTMFSGFKDREDLINGLRAAITTPGAAGPPIEFREDHFLDASVSEPIPVDAAVNDGCTHLLVCGTRPRGTQRKKLGAIHRQLVKSVLGDSVPWITEAEETLPRRYNELVSSLSAAKYKTATIAFAQPSADVQEVFQLEKDRVKLVNGAISGINSIYDILLMKRPQSVETIHPF